jgi:membrane-associated phospholipid phosphatase
MQRTRVNVGRQWRIHRRWVANFATRSAIALLFTAAIAILLGWLSEEVFEGDTERFDAYVRSAVHSMASPHLTSVMRLLTGLGAGAPLVLQALGAIAAFWRCQLHRAVFVLLVTMAGADGLMEALKLGFHRVRPAPYFGIAEPHSYSFPSGHSLMSFAFYATVAAIVTARIPSPWVRALIWAIAAGLIATIGVSRIYLGVHWPTDVAAGYMVGFIWVAAVTAGDRLSRQKTS